MTRILIFLAFFSVSIQCFSAEPSSDIPDKREFPLSAKYKPCNDFHKYVCDEVESSFKLRDDRSRHSFAFSDSAERILEAKKKFFANIQKEKNLSPRSLQVKDFYLACMNAASGKTQEQKYLQKKVVEIAKLKSIEQFKEFQVKDIEGGDYSFINYGTNSNQDSPKVADLVVVSDLMNLPQYTYYDNVDLMKDYQKLLADFFRLVYPKLAEKDVQQKADRLILFEKEFVKIFPHPEVQRQRWSERRQQSQKDFLQKYPDLHFADFFKKVPVSVLVFNAYPESFDFLTQKMTQENLEVLKDLYLYKAVSGHIDDSNPNYFAEQFEFRNKFLGGPKARPKRDERCTRVVMDNFAKELDQIMMPRLFPNFPSEKFAKIVDKIRESIISGVQKNTWLGTETKAKAISKMQKAKLYLVQPQTDEEWDFLPPIKFSTKNKIDNTLLYSKAQNQKKTKEFKEGINLESWWMGPLTINAYYTYSGNKFVIPMGILQYPFFNISGDLTENLGAAGAIVGHELGHGIDDEGSKYDEEGKLNQWMTMKDLSEFSNRGKKLIGFFDKAGHNGTLTLGENIGDLVGLTFAYRAAFGETKPVVEDQKKLFIAYARLWCNVSRPKTEEKQLKTDPHALGWARINEQVKHQKYFAEAFQCKKGDAMYLPESEQVVIW